MIAACNQRFSVASLRLLCGLLLMLVSLTDWFFVDGKAFAGGALSNRVYEQLVTAQQAAEERDYAEALSILDKLSQSSKKPLNDFELANVLNLYAFVHHSREQYTPALKAYRRILTLEKAPQGLLLQARYNLAQTYFVTEQWQQGVLALQEWFKHAKSPQADAYALLAQGYYQLGQHDQSLRHITTAISRYKKVDKVPKENWYGLQGYLYYLRQNYRKSIAVLNETLLYYPKKYYWIQLSGLYGEIKQEAEQLSAMETAYLQNLLDKERELVNLAHLYLANKVPYKAAKVLQQGIARDQIEASTANMELLANAWRSAREIKKSIPAMIEAAKKSDQGRLWISLGSIYLDNEEYRKAVDSFTKGLAKAEVKRSGRARLMLGMAYFNLKRYEQARQSFDLARHHEAVQERAEQWLIYLEKELERLSALENV